MAKIATKIDQVVDVFYVRDFHGQKVDNPGQVSAIKEGVEKALSDWAEEGEEMVGSKVRPFKQSVPWMKTITVTTVGFHNLLLYLSLTFAQG